MNEEGTNAIFNWGWLQIWTTKGDVGNHLYAVVTENTEDPGIYTLPGQLPELLAALKRIDFPFQTTLKRKPTLATIGPLGIQVLAERTSAAITGAGLWRDPQDYSLFDETNGLIRDLQGVTTLELIPSFGLNKLRDGPFKISTWTQQQVAITVVGDSSDHTVRTLLDSMGDFVAQITENEIPCYDIPKRRKVSGSDKEPDGVVLIVANGD